MLDALKEQSSGTGQGRGHTLFRKAAIVTQVALALLVLAVASLFSASLYHLRVYDPGFRTQDLLTFRVDPGLNGYEDRRGLELYEDLLAELGRLPGIGSAAAAVLALLGHSSMSSSLRVERYREPEGEPARTSRNLITPGFFRTLGIPLLPPSPLSCWRSPVYRLTGLPVSTRCRPCATSNEVWQRRIPPHQTSPQVKMTVGWKSSSGREAHGC